MENLRKTVFPNYLTYNCAYNAYTDFTNRFVEAINFISRRKDQRFDLGLGPQELGPKTRDPEPEDPGSQNSRSGTPRTAILGPETRDYTAKQRRNKLQSNCLV